MCPVSLCLRPFNLLCIMAHINSFLHTCDYGFFIYQDSHKGKGITCTCTSLEALRVQGMKEVFHKYFLGEFLKKSKMQFEMHHVKEWENGFCSQDCSLRSYVYFLSRLEEIFKQMSFFSIKSWEQHYRADLFTELEVMTIWHDGWSTGNLHGH